MNAEALPMVGGFLAAAPPNIAMQPTGMSESLIENLSLAVLCPGG